jgi:hypothetical protein
MHYNPRAMRPIFAGLAAAALAASSAAAQTIELGELPCLPTGENAPFTARVAPAPAADVSVRLYFRRLNLVVEDLYYVEMVPAGDGNYWAVFPQPEKSRFPRKDLKSAAGDRDLWAKWWRAKEGSDHRDPNSDLDRDEIREKASAGRLEERDWLDGMEDPPLQVWLETLATEPAEYFVALHDADGRRIARSPQRIVEVRDDCRAPLTPRQLGFAQNLTVGETARWQAGKPVFHWECTGLVTRIDPQLVLRADEVCRACVVAWWPVVGAGALGALGLITVIDDDPPEVSPSRP